MNKEELYNELIAKVIERIKKDIANGDITAIEELLQFVSINYLIGFLSEEEWVKYEELKDRAILKR